MSKDNGGPAFPWGEHGTVLGGMTLRDYFAAHASDADIHAILANHLTEECKMINAASYSIGIPKVYEYSISRQQARYIHADAMLAERDKEQGE